METNFKEAFFKFLENKYKEKQLIQLGKEVQLELYTYYCDRGSVKVITNNGAEVLLENGIGDGDYSLIILRAPGWGPAMFKDKESYEIYDTIISDGWIDYNIVLQDTDKIKWKALFCDTDSSFEDDGVELNSDFIKCYHRLTKISEETDFEEEVFDSEILIVCYEGWRK